MSAAAFVFTSPNPLISQPDGAGEKLIFRSDNSADADDLSLTGLVSGTSTTDTSGLNGKIEVQTADTFTSLTQGTLDTAQIGTVSVYGQGTAATGDLRVDTLPANNDNLKVGLLGFERTYLFKTSLTGAANEIKIAASVGAQATNIYEALNAGANAGTDYGTGTAANAYLVGTAPTGAVMPFTDRIAIDRQLAWNVSQTVGSTLTIRQPVGGVTGTLLAQFSAGVVQTYDSFTLSSEDISVATLPALFTGTSDPISISGKVCSLRFKGSGISSGIAMNYQVSTDGTNWATHVTAISNVTNSHTIAAPQRVIPGEQNVERIRLNITANANTSDIPLDARAIY